jgi:hypothetical protein
MAQPSGTAPTTFNEDSGTTARVGLAATPVIAAAYAAGIGYMWLEAAFRIAFTYSPSFNGRWMLWNGRVGDIAAMWLTISGVSLVLFFGFGYWLFRGRTRVGTIVWWTIALIVSAIVAPLVGEIGTPIGV